MKLRKPLLPGQRFGLLTVREYVGQKWHSAIYLGECDCGSVTECTRGNLVRGLSRSCGCARMVDAAHPGERFGRLTVVDTDGAWCVSVCDCGTRGVRALISLLRSGHKQSCGCLLGDVTRKRNMTHGESHLPEYDSWLSARRRCSNPQDRSYPTYGGAGRKMCDEWMNSFESFLAHVWKRPSPKHTIERIDNERGYEPGNVRWATMAEQGRNKRSNRWIEFNGERLIVSDWARRLGIKHESLMKRIRRHPIEVALTSPKGSLGAQK